MDTQHRTYASGICYATALGLIRHVQKEDDLPLDKDCAASGLSEYNTRPLHPIGRRIAEVHLAAKKDVHALFCGPGVGIEAYDFLDMSKEARADTIALTPFNPFMRMKKHIAEDTKEEICNLLISAEKEKLFPSDINPDYQMIGIGTEALYFLQRKGRIDLFYETQQHQFCRIQQHIGDFKVVAQSLKPQAEFTYDYIGACYWGLCYGHSPVAKEEALHALLPNIVGEGGTFLAMLSPSPFCGIKSEYNTYAVVECEHPETVEPKVQEQPHIFMAPYSPVRKIFGFDDTEQRTIQFENVYQLEQAMGIASKQPTNS